MTTNGQNDGVNVTVSSVNGGTVNFDIIETVSKDDICRRPDQQTAQPAIRARTRIVTCPDNLKGTVGAALRCTFTDCNWTRTDGYSAHP
jgi:hypothetical protein